MNKELKALSRIKKDEFYVLSHYEYNDDSESFEAVYEKTDGLSRTECFKIVRQALLKSREMKKVLKWLCDFLFLEPKQIVDKYYIKYMNREEGNYILEEVSKEEFDILKEWLKCLKN